MNSQTIFHIDSGWFLTFGLGPLSGELCKVKHEINWIFANTRREIAKKKMQFFVTKKRKKIKQKCAIIQPKCWKFLSHSNRLGSRDSKITHGKI